MSFTGLPLRGGLAACAAMLALLPGAGTAEITPTELWQSWQAFGATSGQTLSAGGQSEQDGRLVLRDVSADMVHRSGRMHSKIAEIVMTDRGDGSVSVAFSPEYAIILTGKDADGAGFEIKLDARLEEMSMIARGEPDKTSYDIAAAAIRLTTASATRAGEPAPFDLAASFTGIAGTYAMDGSSGGLFQSDLAAEAMTLDLDATDAAQDGSIGIGSEYSGVRISGAGSAAALAGGIDPAALLGGQLRLGGSFSHEGGSVSADLRRAGERLNLLVQSDSGTMTATLADQGLRYEASGAGLDLALSGTRVPMAEIRFGLDRLSYDLGLPVVPAGETAPFSLMVGAEGITLSDQVWATLDPQSALPHDPAELRLDLSGTARVTADLSDPAAFGGQVPPFAPVTADLNDFRLDFGGSALSGTGALRFDADDLRSYPGYPAPVGAVDVTLEGSRLLTENLVNLGLLPRDQLVFAQLILGMFAKPVEGQDALGSRIEFQPGGIITANGTRIR